MEVRPIRLRCSKPGSIADDRSHKSPTTEPNQVQNISTSIVDRTTRFFEDNQQGSDEVANQRISVATLQHKKQLATERPPPIAKKPAVDFKPKVVARKPRVVHDESSIESCANPKEVSKVSPKEGQKDSPKGSKDSPKVSKEGSPTRYIRSTCSPRSDGSPGVTERVKLLQGQSVVTPPDVYAKVDVSAKKKNKDLGHEADQDVSHLKSDYSKHSLPVTPQREEELGGEYATLKVLTGDPDVPHSGQPFSQISPQTGPPKKPPRTFAHDNYAAQKLLRQKKIARSDARKVRKVIEDVPSSRTTDSAGYEVVEFAENKQDPLHPIIENSGNVVTPVKGNVKYSTIHRIRSDKNDSEVKRPCDKPPPPPRPPLPSPRSSMLTSDPQRWEKPHINVKQHNERLSKAAFLGKGKVSNPSYEADWSIIRIKSPKSDGDNLSGLNLKRSKSDECLYAEPIVYRDKVNESTYCDPADAIRHGKRDAQVIYDAEGYAVPHHRQTPPPVSSHNSLHRMNTVINSQTDSKKYKKAPYHFVKSPDARLRSHPRERPHMQEKLSEAYSVLRLNLVQNEEAVNVHDNDDNSDSEVDPAEQERRIQYVSTVKLRLSMAVQQSPRRTPQELSMKLFNYAAIIGLEKIEDCNRYKTKVLFHFPQQSAKEMAAISQFCFPDLQVWRPVTIYKSEIFSFVLTDERGEKRYGYCLRTLPPASGNRLPMVFCIVSALDAFAFYRKLLLEIKKKNMISEEYAEMLIQAAFAISLPDPGKEAWIRSVGANDKKETIILKRSADIRQENVPFTTLLSNLSMDNLLKVFASVLLERKIIFVAQHLSTLTCCIHAVCALLYPFVWPHPFIPVLPEAMIEVCQSPTPIIVGVLTMLQPELNDLNLEQVLMIDLDHNTLMMSQGDESRIIPKKLQNALKLALNDDGDMSSSRNILVMESFLRFFVETIGHYTEYICTQMNGEKIFEKKSFIMSVSSKSIRMFLEWFVETQMFEVFITDRMETMDTSGIFETRIMEYRDEMRDTPSIKQNMKQMGRKVKNFFIESGDKIRKKFTSNVYI